MALTRRLTNATRLYSIILSCKELEVDPEVYLEDVLGRVSTTRQNGIAELTPWAAARGEHQEN